MANLFLSYIDKRLEETRKSGVPDLAFYVVDSGGASLSLKSFAGATPEPTLDARREPVARVITSGEAAIGDVSYFPVSFADKTVGVLRTVAPGAGKETLLSLAAQIGCLWVQPAREHAILVDERLAKVRETHRHYDWVGVYKLVKDTLYLVCFRGAPSPHAVIPKANGICGAAVVENRTLNIADVTKDPRYLSCDIRTRSEIVVPIRNDAGEPIGEIDIDSHTPGAFHAADAEALEQLASDLAPLVVNLI